jgi:glycosyltransferase involved in cell wall biosynthesis
MKNHIPLKVVGDGPLLKESAAHVEKHDLNQVELLGRLPHRRTLELMKKARFLVFPSEWYEGFPMTLVEAFACGLPVVASGLGSMQEIVTDQETGLHFEPGNAEDLVSKVEWLWSRPHVAKKMGRAARAEFESKYTAERNYELLMRIYERAIASRN